MPINEVFPNPTVKKVIFQVRYPNLFYVSQKVGDFQLAIMDLFPNSALAYRARAMFINASPEHLQDLATRVSEGEDDDARDRIWEFSTLDEMTKVELHTDRLTIVSEEHKTYQLFRDVIQTVVDAFLDRVVRVPKFTRMGLRYIDDCPVPGLEHDKFTEWYNTTLPLNRFCLLDSELLQVRAQATFGANRLLFSETLSRDAAGQPSLVLDFDGYATDVQTEGWLERADALHELILAEYERSVREPVYEYMRKEPSDADS